MKPTSNQIKNKSLVTGETLTDALNSLRASSGGGSGSGDMSSSVYDTNLNGKVDVAEYSETAPWAGITGKPSSFTPSSHSHSNTDIVGLQNVMENAVLGPNSSTTYAIPRFLGTSGKVVSDSAVTISPAGDVTIPNSASLILKGWGSSLSTCSFRSLPSAFDFNITDPALERPVIQWSISGTPIMYMSSNDIVYNKPVTYTGNTAFDGNIRGDFSSTVPAITERTFVQTNIGNSLTSFGVIPEGTATQSEFKAYAASTPTNTSFAELSVDSSGSYLKSGITGTGTYRPLSFYTGGVERFKLSESANRFQADFSNTTIANRFAFQTTSANLNTVVGAIPNGTATGAGYNAFNSSDPTNASIGQFIALSTDIRLNSTYTGTGSVLPVTVYVGGAEAARLDTSRNMGIGTTTPKARLDVTNTAIGGGAPLTTGSSADPNQSTRLGAGGTALDFGVYNNGTQWIQGRSPADYSIKYGLALNPNGGEVRVGTSNTTGYTLNVATGDTNKYFGVSTDANTAYAYTNGNLAMGCSGASSYMLVTNNIARLTVDSAGTITSSGGAIGYGTGAGGTVTQITSRTTGVALNKPSGEITLVSAAGSASWQTFTLTNSFIATSDSVRCVQKSGTDKYLIHVTNIGSGTCQITFATTGGTTTEQPVFRFEVIKGATA